MQLLNDRFISGARMRGFDVRREFANGFLNHICNKVVKNQTFSKAFPILYNVIIEFVSIVFQLNETFGYGKSYMAKWIAQLVVLHEGDLHCQCWMNQMLFYKEN